MVRIPPISVARLRRHHPPAVAVALALFALCLRLAWPAPMPAGQDFGIAAAFGEHALCLATAAGEALAPISRGPAPAQPGDHADHQSASCCLWHVSGGCILSRVAPFARTTFAARVVALIASAATPPSRTATPLQARAPPTGA